MHSDLTENNNKGVRHFQSACGHSPVKPSNLSGKTRIHISVIKGQYFFIDLTCDNLRFYNFRNIVLPFFETWTSLLISFDARKSSSISLVFVAYELLVKIDQNQIICSL